MSTEDTKKSLDKRMSLKEAISRFVFDGCSIVFSGMGGQQVVAPTYEILRQGQKNLTLIGDSPCECGDYLIGTGQVKRIEVAWLAFAVAGVSPNYRRAVERGIPGKIEVYEFSNYTMGLRLMAGALNIPFMPTRSLIGSSIAEYNEMIKIIDDPYGNGKVALVPAATPDVAIVHVNRADKLGNSQFLGFSSNAENMARAAKSTIVTCEEVVSTDEIRKAPGLTGIPQYVVDAVVEVPYCCHPWNMPYAYAYDIPFHMEMMAEIETEEGFKARMDEWVMGCKDHEDYCEKVGWNRLRKLTQIERKFCKCAS
ncbi:CoA transferase subunit A [Desulfomonile tiedjei]|uniref:Acyl CoA:acetate/3-ketoacid CoA transferase, alpha subunit n=1 Tax=Desulfomonile tiedjei (strain ATCC 49306 / DSM 6799 / DCB-1) TaxID=706587 RepID=I4C1T8_DESTA|nr:CoA-transferase [Desulfomonile tiedjei]AFM23529.1 acyl CoA:acetate/3-ketoacid CoA transferase, alpha subunit [Desulfomonile tiedjei DSM 6799]